MSLYHQNVIENLRRQNYKVRVTHRRQYFDLDENRRPVVRELARFESPGLKYALPNGGSTTVKIVTPEGEEIESTTVCSNSDQFNKKKAVRVALGRILKARDDISLNKVEREMVNV